MTDTPDPGRRRALAHLSPANATNPGLALTRLAFAADSQGAGKRKTLDAALQALENLAGDSLYRHAFTRRRDRLAQAGCRQRMFELAVDGRLAIGLGQASPIETGVRLHPLYGVPLLPASAIKGLAAHYAHETWGDAYRRSSPSHAFLFGSPSGAGAVSFHDAWPLPSTLKSCLAPDVMTVHHPGYYRAHAVFPTDHDEPQPLPFLAVTGSFSFALTTDIPDPAMEAWLSRTEELVVEALQAWGIGAKTRAGYGRMAPPPPPPRHPPGTLLEARRVPDPRGRNRPWFEALDGSGDGNVLEGGTPRDGDTVQLIVYAPRDRAGYTFCWPDAPQAPRRPSGSTRTAPARRKP